MFKTIEQLKKKEKGFSLLELSVAVGVAAIVAAVAVTATTVFVNGAAGSAELYEAGADQSIANAEASFDALWGESGIGDVGDDSNSNGIGNLDGENPGEGAQTPTIFWSYSDFEIASLFDSRYLQEANDLMKSWDIEAYNFLTSQYGFPDSLVTVENGFPEKRVLMLTVNMFSGAVTYSSWDLLSIEEAVAFQRESSLDWATLNGRGVVANSGLDGTSYYQIPLSSQTRTWDGTEGSFSFMPAEWLYEAGIGGLEYYGCGIFAPGSSGFTAGTMFVGMPDLTWGAYPEGISVLVPDDISVLANSCLDNYRR